MSPMQSHIVDHLEDPPAPLKFERRCADRWSSDGTASIFVLGGNDFGRIQELAIEDLSAGGFGAISDSPIEPGTLVSIGFSHFGAVARRGIVRRCFPCGRGYRIGIQFEMGLAA